MGNVKTWRSRWHFQQHKTVLLFATHSTHVLAHTRESLLGLVLTARSTSHTQRVHEQERRPCSMAYNIWTMACRCVCQIYHPRSRSSEVCSLDKPLASLGVYLGCKLPLTSTSGGIFGIHTSKPWFIYYIRTRTLYTEMLFFMFWPPVRVLTRQFLNG